MMVRFLTEPAEIRKAQRSMVATFRLGARRIPDATIGYPSGKTERDVYWHQRLRFWGSLNREPPSEKGRNEKGRKRFWNAFGTQDPNASSASLSIVCEVNPAHRGDSRNVAGFFGRSDEAGRTILLHKGLLNSNKPGRGLTMKFFWQHFKGNEVEIDGLPYALVCEVGSSRMVADMAKFVFEAQRIKKLHNARLGSG